MIAPISVETPRPSRNEAAKSTALVVTHSVRHNLPVATKLPMRVLAVGVGGYAGVIGAFWITFGSARESAFVLVIVSLFALMYFGLPYLMNRTATKREARKEWPQSISDFLTGDFETLNGRISGWSAFMQYAFLPIALAFGAAAIGVIVMFVS